MTKLTGNETVIRELPEVEYLRVNDNPRAVRVEVGAKELTFYLKGTRQKFVLPVMVALNEAIARSRG